MNRLILFIAVCLPLLTALPGCGTRFLSPRESNPVVEDYLGTWPNREIGSLATKAGHRVNMTRMADGIVVDEHQWQRGEYCMEPPPDAMENVAALFTAKALGEAKTTDPKTGATGEGKGEAEFMRSMATAMAPLLRRSQGLQWARDYMTFLCNSHQNRRLSKEEYKELTKIIIDKSFELINKEIEHLPKFEISLTGGLPPPPAAPGATKTSGTTSPDSMGAGTVRPPVPVMMSPTPEVPTVKPDTKPTASPIKSFFQRLWNW